MIYNPDPVLRHATFFERSTFENYAFLIAPICMLYEYGKKFENLYIFSIDIVLFFLLL